MEMNLEDRLALLAVAEQLQAIKPENRGERYNIVVKRLKQVERSRFNGDPLSTNFKLKRKFISNGRKAPKSRPTKKGKKAKGKEILKADRPARIREEVEEEGQEVVESTQIEPIEVEEELEAPISKKRKDII